MWFDVGNEIDFVEGKAQVVEINQQLIAVVKIENEFYAIEDRCSHAGVPLSGGKISCKEVICPRHGARFSLKSGKALCMPAFEDIKVFPVQVHQGVVQVQS